MSTEIQTQQNFEERMMDRIKDSIGDLLTDDDLKKICERGVEKALFAERKRHRNTNYGYRDEITVPSIVDEAVTKFVDEQVRAAVDKWLRENPSRIKEAIDKALELGAGRCMLSALDDRFNSMFRDAANNIVANMPR